MIDFAKEMFIGCSKHANSSFIHNHENIIPKHLMEKVSKKEIDQKKLRSLYLSLLEIESTFFNIENDQRYKKSHVNALKQKIINLKLLIARLEEGVLI